MPNDQLPPNIKAFLDNAMRLLDDANLLRRSGRKSSAFVLAVICMEEIGKVILKFWRLNGIQVSRKGRSAHIQKQSAVACLVIAGEITPEFRKLAVDNRMGDELSAAPSER